MDLRFRTDRAVPYFSMAQKIRIMSEDWACDHVYCPACGSQKLTRSSNNSPVVDFRCPTCSEEYELKSKKGAFGSKVVDGSYKAMMERLGSDRNPNLFLLNYDLPSLSVTDLRVVPKHFFTVNTIEPRKPLSPSARRAGWTGCSILIASIPASGQIPLVRSRIVSPKHDVLATWRKTLFLRTTNKEAKGWLLNVMKRIEQLGKRRFSLSEVYAFEAELSRLYPSNNHVRHKIRQQLQVLRDNGHLAFNGRGSYEVI